MGSKEPPAPIYDVRSAVVLGGVGVPPAGSGLDAEQNAKTTATAPTRAAATQAACTPGKAGAPPEKGALVITVTEPAVADASWTCCRVALPGPPCE